MWVTTNVFIESGDMIKAIKYKEKNKIVYHPTPPPPPNPEESFMSQMVILQIQ